MILRNTNNKENNLWLLNPETCCIQDMWAQQFRLQRISQNYLFSCFPFVCSLELAEVSLSICMHLALLALNTCTKLDGWMNIECHKCQPNFETENAGKSCQSYHCRGKQVTTWRSEVNKTPTVVQIKFLRLPTPCLSMLSPEICSPAPMGTGLWFMHAQNDKLWKITPKRTNNLPAWSVITLAIWMDNPKHQAKRVSEICIFQTPSELLSVCLLRDLKIPNSAIKTGNVIHK